MVRDILIVATRLYVFHNTRLLLAGPPAAAPLAAEKDR